LEILTEESLKWDVAPTDRTEALAREEAEYGLADTIFVLSAFAKQSFVELGVPAKKIELLPLGVDTEFFRPGPQRSHRLPLKVVYFGSVSIRKGVRYLCEAVKHFSLHELKLTVVGPVEKPVRELLARFPQIHWKRPMTHSELAEFLPSQDVFVLPTLEDGFGQTLFQAMACGLVCISTDRCGAAQVIADGKNGHIVEAANPSAIRERLSVLVGSASHFEKLQRATLETRPQLSWSRYTDKWNEWLNRFSHIRGIGGKVLSASG